MSPEQQEQVKQALEAALYRLKSYDYQAMQGTIAKVEAALTQLQNATPPEKIVIITHRGMLEEIYAEHPEAVRIETFDDSHKRVGACIAQSLSELPEEHQNEMERIRDWTNGKTHASEATSIWEKVEEAAAKAPEWIKPRIQALAESQKGVIKRRTP